jgi:hypothetical protein
MPLKFQKENNVLYKAGLISEENLLLLDPPEMTSPRPKRSMTKYKNVTGTYSNYSEQYHTLVHINK